MTPNPQYPGQPAGGPQKNSGLAVAALVCALVGIPLLGCFGIGVLVELVAIGLAIAALVQIGNDPRLGGRGLAIAAIVLPCSLMVVSGLLAAIAIPNFIRFQARSKQSECKAHLKSAHIAEVSYQQEKGSFDPRAREVGFIPDRGNRYAYFLDVTGPMENRAAQELVPNDDATSVDVDTFKYGRSASRSAREIPASLAGGVKPGVNGRCPDCTFVAVCVGNVDSDATLDVWSVSTGERTGPNGEHIPAGQPFNDVNDVHD